ncbi:phosphatidylglycerophosphatase A [Thalassotalea sp. HSM 43]|uniref:phosphatidylglycerophosphatase A family protein n=1 Tax=Thalassotalea sp. HSM 43 TaxID=2552945 RepID=UPI001081EB50|nr:phosphatidylglycerophosphatase A [Thalassotalea sp. HSM 43]QBY03379.1 phosphatidylglycerophosphatase A [Thalassotalea sp. HSM 43]
MSNKNASQLFNLSNPVHFLALGFGTGLAPKAPGTFGTLAALPFIFILAQFSLPVYIVATIIMSVVGIWICGKASADAKVHDHGAIVWDEVAGYTITMIAIPLNWQTLLVGFIIFRIFDILKPWPISIADKKVHGGFGIMLDDIIAGVLSLALMHLIF